MVERLLKDITVSDFLSEAGVQDLPEGFDKDRLDDKLNQLYEGPPVSLEDTEPYDPETRP